MLLLRLMSVPTSISYVVWVVGGAGNLLALGLILRRRLYGEFPWFFSYVLFHAMETLVALMIYRYFGRTTPLYFYEYWAAQAIGLALRFGVIYEIFYHFLRPYEGLRRGSTLVFRWLGLVLLVVALWIAIAGPSNEPAWAIAGTVVAERSINVVQCGLLLLLFLFASYFALTWRNYVLGIALGFGVIATIELLASALAAQSPFFANGVFGLLPRISYDLAVIIWVAYLLSPEPSRAELKALPQHELERWNRELLELLQR